MVLEVEEKKSEGRTGRASRRLSPADRERHIVDEAIKFFAEVGFGGQTRELAQRIGVTQPLIYRYFATKSDLIERVYQEVYINRWDPDWERLLADRERPVRERLIAFYQRYTDVIFSYEWMRIYMYAGLRGADFNKRYLKLVEERVLRRICVELRAEEGRAAEEAAITGQEMELAWTMQAGIFYYGVRKYIFGAPVYAPLESVIANHIDALFDGLPEIMAIVGGP